MMEPDAIGCTCVICGEWQRWTPSGMVCKNGHGGAEGVNHRLFTHSQQASSESATTPSSVQEMAGCMEMFRDDMIKAGVIDAGVPPMFMTEAIFGAIQRAVLIEREACALVADDPEHVVEVVGYHAQLGDANATARNIAAAIRARTELLGGAPQQPPADTGELPKAWMTFDGEGGYDLCLYDMNESYHDDYIKRNGKKYADWVEPLYTAQQLLKITDDMVLAACRELAPILFTRGLKPLDSDGPHWRQRMAEVETTVRKVLAIALAKSST